MKITTISKRFSRKVVHNYQSWEFSTELGAVVEPTDNVEAISNELFQQAKLLVEKDILLLTQQVENMNGGQSNV